MKNFLAIFLLIVMVVNVSVSFVQQMQGRDLYELKECNTDDADEKSKVEKEKEKEIYHFNANSHIKTSFFNLIKLKKQIFIKNDNLVSERHTLLPEFPPEA